MPFRAYNGLASGVRDARFALMLSSRDVCSMRRYEAIAVAIISGRYCSVMYSCGNQRMASDTRRIIFKCGWCIEPDPGLMWLVIIRRMCCRDLLSLNGMFVLY